MHQWPNYELDDRVWRPENGLLRFKTVLKLMLLCHWLGKCWCFCIEIQVSRKSAN